MGSARALAFSISPHLSADAAKRAESASQILQTSRDVLCPRLAAGGILSGRKGGISTTMY